MKPYHKIQSPWKRDHNTGAFLPEWSRPEFNYLKNLQWQWSEKLDGTNVRIILQKDTIDIRGRTNNAEFHPDLLTILQQKFDVKRLQEVFTAPEVSLYGEGIGPKIQKGGGLLSPSGPNFVLFDIRIGNTWFTQEDMRNIAKQLGILAAPFHGYGTILEAREIVKGGFLSYLPGSVVGTQAEGLVLRPYWELLDRRGNRIITKLKTKDFS